MAHLYTYVSPQGTSHNPYFAIITILTLPSLVISSLLMLIPSQSLHSFLEVEIDFFILFLFINFYGVSNGQDGTFIGANNWRYRRQ